MPEKIVLNMRTPAVKYLCQRDRRLAKVISMVGEISYTPYDDGFVFLVRQIVNQMLSNKVGAVLCGRLEGLCDGAVSPDAILKLEDDDIRGIGISRSKAGYIKNLAKASKEGIVCFDEYPAMTDDEVFRSLTSLRGIGAWSAKMYLIFALDRQDVLPYEDAAFLQGYGWTYSTDDVSPASVKKRCRKWSPYASAAARYMYRALDSGLTKRKFQLLQPKQ